MKIKDIGTVVTGKTPATSHAEFYDGDYMFVTPTELHGGYKVSSSEKTITDEGLKSIKSNTIDGISVLVGCIGWDMGNVAMCFEKCATNQQINSVTKIRDCFNPYYLYYWLSTKKDYLFSIASVTRTPILSKGVFEEIEIPNTDRLEQDKISKMLLLLDQKIEYNAAVNDNLQQQIRLLYDYWFTQFDFPDENGKPYRSSGGAMVWNSTLKAEIPLGWTVGVLSDCIAKVSTGLNPRDNFKLGNGSIRYITVKNLTMSGVLDFSGCDTIDEAAQTLIHRRSDISKGDILFASIAPLGRCYLIEQNPTEWEINESVFSLRPNIEMTTAEFLYSYFTSPAFIKGATSSSTGSVFKGIRINTLLDTEVLIPPYRIASAFSTKVRGLFSMLDKNAAEISTLSDIRDWLLPMLMNGQATISD